MGQDIKEFLEFMGWLVAVIAVAAILMSFMLIPFYYLSKYQCSNYQETTGLKTKYKIFDSCYIQTKSGWQRWDEYKMRATASEGLLYGEQK